MVELSKESTWKMKVILTAVAVLIVLGTLGCKTTGSRGAVSGKTGAWGKGRSVSSEPDLPTPEWWYARREYDKNYMHWGVVRHPDAAPKWEKWVLLDEDFCKAPHRRLGRSSADNHCEYKFYGYFLEKQGYEPASDEFCPVFVLQRWEPLNPAKSKPAETPDAENKPAAEEKPEVQEQVPQGNSGPAEQTPPSKPKPKPQTSSSKPQQKKKTSSPVPATAAPAGN
jgi:hypothetical protein